MILFLKLQIVLCLCTSDLSGRKFNLNIPPLLDYYDRHMRCYKFSFLFPACNIIHDCRGSRSWNEAFSSKINSGPELDAELSCCSALFKLSDVS